MVQQACLLVDGKEEPTVPLKNINVEVSIIDFAAEVALTMTYYNDDDYPLEVKYCFPNDDKAAVSRFECLIDGRHIVSQLEEQKKAEKTFNDAIESNHSAALLTAVNSELLSIKIGRFPPKSECAILLVYNTELKYEANMMKFFLPLSTFPKYHAVGGLSKIEAVENTPEFKANIPYDFKLTTIIHCSSNITEISSPSDAIVIINNAGGLAAVEVSPTELNHDIIIMIETENPPITRGWLETNTGAAAVSLVSEEATDFRATDIVFVVDRSGSMGGNRIVSARQTLKFALRSIPPDCTFNIISFGSTHSKMFRESVPYNDENLTQASNEVGSFGSNLGGTEVLKPLKDIYRSKSKLPRSIILLTDGGVSNSDACIAEVKKHSRTDWHLKTLCLTLDGYHQWETIVQGILNRTFKSSTGFSLSGTLWYHQIQLLHQQLD